MYIDDYGDHLHQRLFYYGPPDGGIINYFGLQNPDPDNNNVENIMICPTLQHTHPTVHRYWGYRRNYSVNVYSAYDGGQQSGDISYTHYSQIRLPSERAYFMDGRPSWIPSTQSYFYDANVSGPGSSRPPEELVYPHGDGNNVSFMDGHVARVPKEVLLDYEIDDLFWR